MTFPPNNHQCTDLLKARGGRETRRLGKDERSENIRTSEEGNGHLVSRRKSKEIPLLAKNGKRKEIPEKVTWVGQRYRRSKGENNAYSQGEKENS